MLRRLCLFALIIIISINLPAQVQTARYISTNPKSNAYYEYLPQGYDPAGTSTYPLIVFFHGAGELGAGNSSSLPLILRNGPPKQINQGIFPTSFTVNGVTSKFIVISPQFTERPTPPDINTLLNYIIANYKVDVSRVYFTGLSLGGGMVWDYATYNAGTAGRLAAIVPICGAGWPNQGGANVIAASNLPVWATHNDGDGTVPATNTTLFVSYINGAPVPPTPRAKQTIFVSTSHDAWTKTYDFNFKENNLNVYEWMLSNSRANGTNSSPIASAGSNQTITLPVNTVSVNGSGLDYDGTISSYAWTKISGPASGGGTITSPSSASTTITNLLFGVYTFRLTVTDNNGATGTSDITIVVLAANNNVAPTANAGNNQTINLPTNTATLSGSGTDSDGTISSYAWSKVSGPTGGSITSPSSASTTVTALQAGAYVFRLTVTDNAGATGTSNVTINVIAANVAPTANAGTNQTINLPSTTATLTGSGTDSDGTITSYAWTKFSGPTGGTISSPSSAITTVTALQAGTYVFRLTVTDNAGATASSDVTITVVANNNVAPTANAGTNQTINLPANTATLTGSGTDSDGSITNYAWTKFSGPTGGSITSPATASTTVTALQAGVYVFRLTVTDNAGATASSDVTITVVAVVNNIAPVAYAGVNQTITLPNNTATVTGTGTDADGTITGFSWVKVNGPASGGGIITSPTSATTTITSLQFGVYLFRLTVSDNNGATASSDLTIVVMAAPSNAVPTANAGINQTINLPTNTTTLTGSGTDTDGTISSYGWTKVSGPSGGTITSPSSATTTVTALQAGAYVYKLTVTDNAGATGTSNVTITVVSANAAPVANAGPDQTIILPVNTTTLSGNGMDTDGNIVSYAWSMVSGPTGGNITTPTGASTTITALQIGVYVYRLRVTDNNGASAIDDVMVTVAANPVGPQSNTIKVNLYSGADPYNNPQWNNWNTSSGLTSATFLTESQNVTGVKATLSLQTGTQDNGFNFAATSTTCPPEVLRYNSFSSRNRTLVLTGLNPAKTYSIQFFGSSIKTGNKTTFVIGKIRALLNTDNNVNNFATISGVVASGGTVKVNILTSGTYNYLAGFIIKEEGIGARSITTESFTEEKDIIEEVAELEVFPNPVQTTLTIKVGIADQHMISYTITDVNGRVMHQSQKLAQQPVHLLQVNMSAYKPGIYFLRLNNNGKILTRKIIKG